MDEVALYKRSGSQSLLIPPAAISATLTISLGGAVAQNVAACFDGNASTSCSTGAPDPRPALSVRFPCNDSGAASGTLTSVVVQLSPSTNATEFELVTKNSAGQVEQALPFPDAQQGLQRPYVFQLDGRAGEREAIRRQHAAVGPGVCCLPCLNARMAPMGKLHVRVRDRVANGWRSCPALTFSLGRLARVHATALRVREGLPHTRWTNAAHRLPGRLRRCHRERQLHPVRQGVLCPWRRREAAVRGMCCRPHNSVERCCVKRVLLR